MRAWDYPKEKVVITCDRCNRRGEYSKERFLDIVGRNTSVADALRIIAKDCARVCKDNNMLLDRCEAYYPDL